MWLAFMDDGYASFEVGDTKHSEKLLLNERKKRKVTCTLDSLSYKTLSNTCVTATTAAVDLTELSNILTEQGKILVVDLGCFTSNRRLLGAWSWISSNSLLLTAWA
jgi:hypothetical protein